MRICKIWDADYPWDIRVDKVTQALASAGHSIHLVCRNLARRDRYESNGNLTIHRLPVARGIFAPMQGLWNFPCPVNPVWIYAILQLIRKFDIDLILVRDILLAVPGAVLGKMYRIPVILDMAENYPAMLEDRRLYTHSTFWGRFIRNPAFARWIERLSLRLVDHIIVVIEESRARLLDAGIPSDRLTIVCNTPKFEQWSCPGVREYPPISNDGMHVVYLGNLDGSRGLDVAIRAIGHLRDQGLLAKLTAIGDGPCAQSLAELSFQLDLADRVKITGRLPFPEVQEIMHRSHIGIIPHYTTAAWNSTIPNKLFDYMLLGLPVIVSDTKPASRIVRTEGCGVVFRDRDAIDLARCMAGLIDPELRALKGRRGQAAVSRLYNWNYDSQVLVHTVETVGSRYRQ